MAPTRLVLLEKEKVSDTNAKVVEIVAERLSVGADTVKPESSFINDLGADSLDIVELVMEFEEAFDIQIPDEDSESIRTVGEAVSYIEGATGGGGGADAGGDDAGGDDAGGDDAGEAEAPPAPAEEMRVTADLIQLADRNRQGLRFPVEGTGGSRRGALPFLLREPYRFSSRDD